MSSKTVWVRGRPVRGLILGLLMGLGVFLLMTKFALIPIDTGPLVGTVAGGGVVGVLRALIGRPYKVVMDEGAPAASEP